MHEIEIEDALFDQEEGVYLTTLFSKETYYRVIHGFGGKIKQHLKDNFVSFVVIGSLGKGDVVPGWSDIDSVLVVKDKSKECLKVVNEIKSEVERDNPWLMSDYGSWFTVWIVTQEEFLYGSDNFPSKLNLIDFKRIGKTILGEDLISKIKAPEIDREEIVNIFLEYWNWLKKMEEKGYSPFWKGRNAIMYVLDAARYALLVSGIYVSTKKDIVEKFELNFPNFRYLQILKKAYMLREEWVKVKGDQQMLNQIYLEALQFLKEIYEEILKNLP